MSTLKRACTQTLDAVLGSTADIDEAFRVAAARALTEFDALVERLEIVEAMSADLNADVRTLHVGFAEDNVEWKRIAALVKDGKINDAFEIVCQADDDRIMIRLIRLTGPSMDLIDGSLYESMWASITRFLTSGHFLNDVLPFALHAAERGIFPSTHLIARTIAAIYPLAPQSVPAAHLHAMLVEHRAR